MKATSGRRKRISAKMEWPSIMIEGGDCEEWNADRLYQALDLMATPCRPCEVMKHRDRRMIFVKEAPIKHRFHHQENLYSASTLMVRFLRPSKEVHVIQAVVLSAIVMMTTCTCIYEITSHHSRTKDLIKLKLCMSSWHRLHVIIWCRSFQGSTVVCLIVQANLPNIFCRRASCPIDKETRTWTVDMS